MRLPQFLHKYFWDIDVLKADLDRYPDFYIIRILEYGDKKALSWLSGKFSEARIKKNIGSRVLSPKSRNYFKNLYSNA